jgi:hypothetical protein
MPTYSIKGPDGKTYSIKGPPGAKRAEIVARIKLEISRQRTQAALAAGDEPKPPKLDPMLDPTGGFAENALAGAGKFMTEIGHGAQDMFAEVTGNEEMQKRVEASAAEHRRLDQPLMDTAGGMTGYIGAGVTTGLPAMAVPGVNTALGGAALGAAYGAFQPTIGDESRMQNMAMGGAAGGAGQAIGNAAGRGLANRAAARTAPRTPRELLIQRALDAGIVLEPTDTNPTIFNKIIGAVSGQNRTRQTLSARNAGTINRIAAGRTYAEIGRAAQAYRATAQMKTKILDAYDGYIDMVMENTADRIKELDDLFQFMQRESFDARNIMQRIRGLREDAADYLSSIPGGSASKRSVKIQKGTIIKEVADALEDMVEENLQRSGNQSLFNAFREARVRIAKTYTYEPALKPSGDIIARTVANQGKRGKPLSGGSKLISDLSQEFPKVTAEVRGGANPNSVLRMGVGAGALGAGNIPLASIMAAGPAANAAIRTPMINRMIANPMRAYDPGMAQVGQGLLNSRGGRAMMQGLAPAMTGYWNPFQEQLPPPQYQSR